MRARVSEPQCQPPHNTSIGVGLAESRINCRRHCHQDCCSSLNRGDAIPNVRTDECLDDIEKYGIHVTEAHIRITESVI